MLTVVGLYAKTYIRNPKDKNALTPSQTIFAQRILDVGRDAAAREAYPNASQSSSRYIGIQNMSKENVVRSISKIAEERGLTKDSCVDAIKKGLADDKQYLKAAELGLRLHGELSNFSADEKNSLTMFAQIIMASLSEARQAKVIETTANSEAKEIEREV